MKHLIYSVALAALLITPASAHLFDNLPQDYLKQSLTDISVCLTNDLVATQKLTEIYKAQEAQKEGTDDTLGQIASLEQAIKMESKVGHEIAVTLEETYQISRDDVLNPLKQTVETAVAEMKAKLADVTTTDDFVQAYSPIQQHCNDMQKKFIETFKKSKKDIETPQ